MSIPDNSELVFDHVSTPEGIPTVDSDVDVNRTDDSTSVEENGRTYHKFKEGKYPLPNDVKEQERLDLQHEMLRIALRGKLYLAPIGEPKQVMDIATGTGKWAIEFANQHPTSQVLGTDLSAIQPTTNISPNIRWEIEDAEDEWIYKSQFDYIHARAVMSCFKDHSAVLRSIFEALTPGGWFELQDAIMPMQYMGPTPTSSALYKWNTLLAEGAQKAARPITNTQHYKRWMQEIGFVDVVEKQYFLPTSSWPKEKYFKEVAALWQKDMMVGLEGMSLKIFTGALGWSSERVREFCVEVKRDVLDRRVFAFIPLRVIYGRKPE